MARVAVLHNTLDFQGGADAVCLATCEALQADHEVTLFTISTTAPRELAERFDVSLEDVTVRMPPGSGLVARGLSGLAPWVGAQLAFRTVLLHRFARPRLQDFDVAVSTANELSLPIPSVQYIHQPQFNRRRLEGRTADRLDSIWSHLAGPEPGAIDGSTTLLANSEWTADRVEAIYDTRPAVVYPPVEPIECEESWKDREPGIVLLGRLAPDKRVLEAISLVDAVREQGPEVHLHIVGSAPRAYRRYVARVAWAAQDRPHVTLERNVSRERVEGLLCSHRYGLNMKAGEHFGMAVAEYVSAGMDAFVPASGGQQEIVQDDRTFTDLDEAVDLVSEALRRPDAPARYGDRFHPDRFAASIRQHVNQTID